MISTNIFDNKNPNNMKPIEKPQFFALCEIMSNTHDYYVALGSLKRACERLAEEADHILKIRANHSERWCPGYLLDKISNVELNLELIKQRYIQDRIDEYEKSQAKSITEALKEYHITED